MVIVKNPTQWQPQSGSGYVLVQGLRNFVTNSGAYLITNNRENIITTYTYTVPKYPTTWTESGA